MNKDLKALIKQIERRGHVVVPAGKHLKVKNAAGGTVFTLPTTPSGQLWRVRLETSLRKKGLIE